MAFIKKVCLLGDPAVGKTSLIQRYVYDKFDEKYLSTIGTKPSVKKLKHKSTEVTLTVWDIAGQETFQNVHNSYFTGAAGAVLVCDITNPSTIESLAHWCHRFQTVAKKAPVILVSNKWDLVDEENGVVPAEQNILAFKEAEGCEYIKASVKNDLNINEIFTLLVESVMP